MNTFNLLSAVQIVLESLPVSSSGNVVLLMDFLPYWFSINTLPVLSEQFLFFLHGPTVLVVGIFFFRKWFGYLIKLIKRDKTIFSLVTFGIITNVVTVFFYAINSHSALFGTFQVPLWVGFLITTLLLFSTVFIQGSKNSKLCFNSSSRDEQSKGVGSRSINKNQIKPLSHGIALGLAQSAALFVPGISRFASTFVVGRWVGWSPLVALEYSFLIEFPLICAGFLKGVSWIIKTPETHQLFSCSFLITIALSTILAYAALVFVARCAQNNKIWLFGFYTGLLAVISFLY